MLRGRREDGKRREEGTTGGIITRKREELQ
jgi:hypothetical protein